MLQMVKNVLDLADNDEEFRRDLVREILEMSSREQIMAACARHGIPFCTEDGDCCDRSHPDDADISELPWKDDDIRSMLLAGRVVDALYAIERRMPSICSDFAGVVVRHFGHELV
jgi:hypothetical protein